MRKRLRNMGLLLVLTGALTGCAAQAPPRLPTAQDMPGGTLTATFFSCGKADSILLQQGEYALLVDTGTDKTSAQVLAGLERLGVTKLDGLLITHGDKDHIGGADKVLNALPVMRCLVGESTESGKQVDQFNEALEEHGLRAERLRAGDVLSLGAARVTVLGPLGTGYAQENDFSLMLRVDFGQTRFLLAGDAEKLALTELLAAPDAAQMLPAQVLKVPHHGRQEDVSAAFFQAVAPEYAVICCVEGDEDNLPDKAVLAALDRVGAKTFITGDGDVTIISDGKGFMASQRE